MIDSDAVEEALRVEFDRLQKRVERLSTEVSLGAPMLVSRDPRDVTTSQESRAAAIVYTVAELESFTRSVVTETNKFLNARQMRLMTLRRSLRRLALHDVFESLKTANEVQKVWERRGLASMCEVDNTIARFPVVSRPHPQPPLDGRTPKPQHYALMWSIYGFAQQPFATSAWQTSLQKLSGVRNDFAHGNVPFHEVFQTAGMRPDQILRYLSNITDFAKHIMDCTSEYLRREAYLQETADAPTT